MNNIVKNKTIINTIKESYNIMPNIYIEDNYLIYNNNKIDISSIDLEPLINQEFIHNITTQTEEDIFNYIKEFIKPNNKSYLDSLIKINPLMKNITIFYKNNIEYINIKLSNNDNYLFKNTTNLNILNIYNKLKEIYHNNITLNSCI